MEKTFNPNAIEHKHYKKWEQSGFFAPSDADDTYCIMIPPPNVTGNLHMGHAFQTAIMDALIRYNRMLGKKTLWQVGTDHAGIATQMVVERKVMAEENKKRHEYTRDEFIDKIWEWKQQSGNQITKQLRRLGASVDWATERFTMDDGFSAGVKAAFIKLYDEGLIYRGKRLVNWDPHLKTAISDVEVENKETKGSMWYIKYKIVADKTKDNKDFLIVATTRPETMLGDVAVAINPQDTRYQHLVGKTALIPLVNREIPIIADEHADMSKGTGCVKITPAHDFNDYQVAVRHNLALVTIMDKSAKILSKPCICDLKGNEIEFSAEIPHKYQQLDRFIARKQIITDLQTNNLLEKQAEHDLTIPYGDRSAVVIEPLLTNQWFVAVDKLAKPAIDAVINNDIKFIPSQYQNMYLSWMNNLQDWCISRQLWWGHRIPAWYDNAGNIYVGQTEEAVRKQHNIAANVQLEADNDVLDTWFSSALWTFVTLGWPENTERLKTFHPTDVLVTGFDIIFFWVARMILMSLYLVKDDTGKPQIPFKNVYITGLIRDEKGTKMSKTKGNVLDPLDMIDGIKLEDLVAKRCTNMMQPQLAANIEQATRKQFPEGISAHGTDALRFTLYSLAATGRDINWDMKRLEGYRNFCNKIWNATNYVFLHTEDYNNQHKPTNSSVADRWINSILQRQINKIKQNIADFRLDHAAYNLYDFIWNEYCAWYLELTKPVLFNKQQFNDSVASTQFNLLNVLEIICRLLHPFMPFITEEIWQHTIIKLEVAGDTLLTSAYPEFQDQLIDTEAEDEINWIKDIVTAVRAIRTELNLGKHKPLDIFLKNTVLQDQELVAKHENILQSLAKINTIVIADNDTHVPFATTKIIRTMELQVSLHELIDLAAEKSKLDKEFTQIITEITNVERKLNNQQFISNAPPNIIAKEKTKLEKLTATKMRLTKRIAELTADINL